MNKTQQFSDEFLNAFVDGELSPAERTQAIEQISGDALLKRQVCELNMLKEMVKSSYRGPNSVSHDFGTGRRRPQVRHAIAASCLVVVGVLAGWLGRGHLADDRDTLRTAWLGNVATNQNRIMLHVDKAGLARFDQVLDRAEHALDAARRDGRRIQVELVANSQGIDLLRAATSPYADRLQRLQARYDNLALIGCGQTLKKLQERGQDTRLLPGVHIAPAALDEVVDKLQAGWVYIKV
ncbi:intracellular sulfur oxidation DsrE/DsrF family protein [Sulfuritortus calidifontis]|uniref:Intracellular sulfur oxidation DsrE/DsrF family protein n=1 Tax=Sulfuritortus calidifontis TaxID=1914471 RepID=A0A4R3JXB9_9PROT|nr:DsrE family protein [Sulfuritortus calidifontis]TCS72964.1 intracellular sulfur oxidation DsrE/DsrF family protein [Sulfuritortus calidifontis]